MGVQFVKAIKTVLCNTKDSKRKCVFCCYEIKMLVLDFVTCSILLVEITGLLKLVHGQLKVTPPFLDQSPELVRLWFYCIKLGLVRFLKLARTS